MTKKLLSFLFVILFCISCGTNQNLNPSAKVSDFGPVGPDQDRVEYANNIVNRAVYLLKKVEVSELNAVSEILNKCSIYKATYEKPVKIGSKPDSVCQLLIWKDGDESPYLQDYMNQDLKATGIIFYDHEIEMFVIRMLPDNPESKLSLDYLALVLVHQTIMRIYGDNEVKTLESYVDDQARAYQVEFLLLDVIGNRKNAVAYKKALQEFAETEGPAYEATGTVTLPDYQNDSKNMKMYFESESVLQDKLWLSVFWLRSYWEMYMYIRPDMTAADISFQAFLREMYGSGSMR